VIYGVAAAVLWGLGDLLAKGVVDRLGTCRALLHVQGVGLVFAVVAIWACGVELALPAWPLSGFLGITVCANALSVALLYQALRRGPAMMAVPLSTCSGAIALAFSIAGGTAQASTQAIFLLLAITGAAMVAASQPMTGPRCWRAAALALGSAVAGGLATWSAGRWIGPASTAATGAVLNMGLLSLASLATGYRREGASRPAPMTLVAGAAMANVGGYAAFLAGIMNGRLDETGVLSTLSGAVAACGAAALLGERLSFLQYWGLAATAVLVPLLAAVT
jgi:drug/metabolite transporter (DMT)-like permease